MRPPDEACAAAGWRIWIDRGGTFTDVVALAPGGERLVRKVLSQQPGLEGDPAVRAIAELVGVPLDQPLPAGLIQELRLGTTVATNALLEHRGAPVLLLINRGFADLLTIGDLHRPDLFAQVVKLRKGLSQELAKTLSKTVRDELKKVTVAIQGDSLRVTGKSKDDLQAAIQLLKAQDVEVPLQFENYR
ncbi:MAG: DUF520 family protein [Cyanobacteria bacterium K_Offshore_0m_m2_072]|nr:DUF520 family protein [Cyanobacteria bacterium K_Offshore_0m_m2_072]